MLYVRLTLPQIVKTSCLKSHLWKIWLQFVIGAAYEIALWESNGENNKLTLCSSLSELHLTKLKQIQLKKKILCPVVLNASRSMDLNWIAFFLLKGIHCFPPSLPPTPFFFPAQRFREYLNSLQSSISYLIWVWWHSPSIFCILFPYCSIFFLISVPFFLLLHSMKTVTAD